MHEAFLEYLKKFSSKPLSKSQKELLYRSFSPLKLRKRQYFLQAGNECKQFAFIIKGALRQYIVNEKGVEQIVGLGIEDWWMGDRESFIDSSPSLYHIDAWEDTEMLTINRADSIEIRNIPAILEMINQLDDRNNIANQKRITSLINLSAEKRYISFLECYPQLVSRFPQHIIASYLGITKDTLSRVKLQRKTNPK